MSPKRIRAMLLLCVASVALIALPSPASAAPQVNFPMPVINIGSNKCFQPVEPSGHIEWAGVLVQQRTCFLSYNPQNWTFESKGFVEFNDKGWCYPLCMPDGAEGFFIRNQRSQLCLDARNGARTDRSVVQQWTCRDRNARSMVWYVENGDYANSFKIRNFNSDLCLDVAGGSGADFAQIQQYHCTRNNPAQNFYQALWPR